MRSTVSALAIAAGLGIAACQPALPPPPEMTYELRGRHAELDCVTCHGPPPLGTLPEDCLSCHEADRKTPQHYPGRSCGDAGCHTDSHLSWAGVFGGTGTGTGTPVAHDFLPLVNAHDLECTSCHVSPNYDDLPGKSALCWNCHEADRSQPDHYAVVGQPDQAWDCGPCHTPVTFATTPYVHPARVPHGAQPLGVPSPPNTWVTDCASCHPVSTATVACYSCHAGVHGGTYTEAFCISCHTTAECTTCGI